MTSLMASLMTQDVVNEVMAACLSVGRAAKCA